MEHLDENRLINVFDMLIHRIDTIDTTIAVMKEHLIWQQRNNISLCYRIDGGLFSLPFDITLHKNDYYQCHASCFYYLKMDLNSDHLKTLFTNETHRHKIQQTSKLILNAEQHNTFWNEHNMFVDTQNLPFVDDTMTCEDLNLNVKDFKFADDYIMFDYFKKTFKESELINLIITPRVAHFVLATQRPQYTDQIVSCLMSDLHKLGVIISDISNMIVCPLANAYSALYDVIFHSNRKMKYERFAELLRMKITEILSQGRAIKKDDIRSYFTHPRFVGCVDTDELGNALKYI